jgi:hypothetical protein
VKALLFFSLTFKVYRERIVYDTKVHWSMDIAKLGTRYDTCLLILQQQTTTTTITTKQNTSMTRISLSLSFASADALFA